MPTWRIYREAMWNALRRLDARLIPGYRSDGETELEWLGRLTRSKVGLGAHTNVMGLMARQILAQERRIAELERRVDVVGGAPPDQQ